MKKRLFIFGFIILFSCNNKQNIPVNDNSEVVIEKKSDTIIKTSTEITPASKPAPLDKKAKITSIADGYDVERVNLWSSTSENRVIIDHCVNNEDIIILEYSLPYVKIKKKNGSVGWVMDGFIKK